ncbi:MAG: SPFH domain-containing protein [Roseburia sp.]|nr:SPFH domain-containing protein [Roseburia sp.]
MNIKERELKPKSGWIGVIISALLVCGGIALMIVGFVLASSPDGESIDHAEYTALSAVGILMTIVGAIIPAGCKMLAPGEAYVLTLFGKYHGTVKREGFWFVNPFCIAVNPAYVKAVQSAAKDKNMAAMGNAIGKKLSIKSMTLNNEKQKVNDEDGNPIEISVVVIWRIVDTAKAVFAVDNYSTFISTQCDSAIRQVARQYPYDVSSDGDEKSLRGSSNEIANVLKEELQSRVNDAGLEILEARINNLAYATEIASAMLQRQQASAVIAARQKIVDGAVSMVEMALKKLSENKIVELDDERKAAMVSNLLVILCGNRDAQPVVNSGSIY